MPDFRNELPQMSGDIFLTDAGIETDLIFNHGIEIREFAAHTLLPETEGRNALSNYFNGFLKLATERDVGFILDSQTWKAHMHWADDLGASEDDLKQANNDAIDFI
ncbi:MAG: homocysteine S-methyltransferase, partial [Pseudomonadota bacterium]